MAMDEVPTEAVGKAGAPSNPPPDDWLLKAGSPQAVATHLQTTADLLHSLGFTINVSKSH